MADEGLRGSVYEAIRAFMGRRTSESQFRRTLESLGVPMTADLDRLVKQHSQGSSSAKFADFVRASRITEDTFVPIANPGQRIINEDEEKFGWKGPDDSKKYTREDRPCLGL